MGRDSTYEERLNKFREQLKQYAKDIEEEKQRFESQGLLTDEVRMTMARWYSFLIALNAVLLGIKSDDVDKVLKETIPEGILSGDDL